MRTKVTLSEIIGLIITMQGCFGALVIIHMLNADGCARRALVFTLLHFLFYAFDRLRVSQS